MKTITYKRVWLISTAFFLMNIKVVLAEPTLKHTQSVSPVERSLTNSVRWLRTSKEYKFLTESIYARASKSLAEKALPATPWTVVMDVDETILDNSAYQKNLDLTGDSFHPTTWAEWIEEEDAGLVPGVAEFIQVLFEKGGLLTMVTNRDRAQDDHTWANLLKLGIPVTEQNTCLIGRAKEDKTKIDGVEIVNDKDLRRQAVTSGNASCYSTRGKRHSNFPKAEIIMQVGDNIEDFVGVTQHDADVKSLIKKADSEYILLPNPMYGSW